MGLKSFLRNLFHFDVEDDDVLTAAGYNNGSKTQDSCSLLSDALGVHYKKACSIMAGYENAPAELLPLFYIVTDLAVINSGKDRLSWVRHTQRFVNQVSWQNGIGSKFLDSRMDLYGDVLRGEKELRAVWFMGDLSDLPQNPVFTCCAICGDIIFDPCCAEDYENAPIRLGDIFASMGFVESITKLYSCLVDFYNAVCAMDDKE